MQRLTNGVYKAPFLIIFYCTEATKRDRFGAPRFSLFLFGFIVYDMFSFCYLFICHTEHYKKMEMLHPRKNNINNLLKSTTSLQRRLSSASRTKIPPAEHIVSKNNTILTNIIRLTL